MAELITSGLASLQYYVLKHTLTCLLPAFFLAGAMVTFTNRDAILDLLGEQANIFKAFTLAAAASFLVAACSCTVIPVAAGLYFAGAGVGVAFIILWVAPAANVLALVYTGTILGAEMVTVRIIAALLVAFVVGLVMRAVFGHEHREQNAAAEESDAGKSAAS
ncbi:MAG: permease, partial [Balneolaceae bacterium]